MLMQPHLICVLYYISVQLYVIKRGDEDVKSFAWVSVLNARKG